MSRLLDQVSQPDPTPVARRGFLTRLVTAVLGGIAAATVARKVEAAPGPVPNATDPFLGEIMMWAGNFAPRGWALCNGQLLPISQNTALFSLLGTTYGGNGQTTFALPDLRGRVPIHHGQGPGLSSYSLGQVGGEETHTLTVQEIPAHQHALQGSSANGTSASPAGLLPARNPAGIPAYGSTADAAFHASAIAPAGGGQPHNVMQPYLTINFVIALQGVYPSQN